MTDNTREFLEIYKQVKHLGSGTQQPDLLADYLKALGRTRIESFITEEIPQTSTRRVTGVRVEDVPGGYILHSAHGPSLETTCVRLYCLFDVIFSQDDWFDILGYSVEEQLAHVLVWGRQ